MEDVIKKLNTIHKIQLELALEVKRVCNKYNIKYFLIAGTLLGAIRHKGFIPWDDDMDIGMLREDYEKFLKAWEKETSSKYFLQTWQTETQYALPFAKLRLNGTQYIEQNIAHLNLHSGIFIDIFPFDNTPDNELLKVIHNIKTSLLKRMLLVKLDYKFYGRSNKVKQCIYTCLALLVRLQDRNKLREKLLREIIKYNNKDSEYIVNVGGSYSYKKETIKKEWIQRRILDTFLWGLYDTTACR